MADARAAQTSHAAAALAFVARALLVVSFVLLTQFLLGVVVNLFVEIPLTHAGAGAANYLAGAWRSLGWVFAHEWPFLALHVTVGLGLVVASLTFLVRGLLSHAPRPMLVLNALGATGAVFAMLSGIYFVIHPTVDLASIFMAVGFATALGCVVAQQFVVGRAAAAVAQRG